MTDELGWVIMCRYWEKRWRTLLGIASQPTCHMSYCSCWWCRSLILKWFYLLCRTQRGKAAQEAVAETIEGRRATC